MFLRRPLNIPEAQQTCTCALSDFLLLTTRPVPFAAKGVVVYWYANSRSLIPSLALMCSAINIYIWIFMYVLLCYTMSLHCLMFLHVHVQCSFLSASQALNKQVTPTHYLHFFIVIGHVGRPCAPLFVYTCKIVMAIEEFESTHVRQCGIVRCSFFCSLIGSCIFICSHSHCAQRLIGWVRASPPTHTAGQ